MPRPISPAAPATGPSAPPVALVAAPPPAPIAVSDHRGIPTPAAPATGMPELKRLRAAADAAAANYRAAPTPAHQAAYLAAARALTDLVEQLGGLSPDMRDHYLRQAATHELAAQPLASREAQEARLVARLASYRTSGTARDFAQLQAAQDALGTPERVLPTTATSPAIRQELAPALRCLQASRSPLAAELARRIQAGEIELHMTPGKAMGVTYIAKVSTRRIDLANGEVGPNFFGFSPPFQAAVLLHEYVHVQQKRQVGSFLKGMGDNLSQRALSLARREEAGMAANASEQEAYRTQLAFLAEWRLDRRGLTSSDAGMLAGIEDWLAASRP